MGPLELADLIGLDVLGDYILSGDPRYQVSRTYTVAQNGTRRPVRQKDQEGLLRVLAVAAHKFKYYRYFRGRTKTVFAPLGMVC